MLSKRKLEERELRKQKILDGALKVFKVHGIDVKDLKLNFKQMMARKNDVVDNTTKGIAFLMEKNKITVFKGI